MKLEAQGRHDPCVLPRAVPMVEAMVALVLCDHLLRQRAIALASGRLQAASRAAPIPGVLFDLIALGILAVFVALGAFRGTLAGFLRVATVAWPTSRAFLAATKLRRWSSPC